ncbi:ornithine carbamoyltransferase [Rouxiella sp. WC2420]|uniref:Ornithine carbamoyltransferase n=1 Tax=Rouxiella sp. WC2420 TaxID=3234145 RepID=A0AB39VNF0_9GAMM
MNLIALSELSVENVYEIWRLAEAPLKSLNCKAAWSFEGNGIRTRTTFIQAFQELEIPFIELPNLLKTAERVEDLAGYLDPFYSLYVIREANHQRLSQFAKHSAKPVINAMSSQGHPCEVLTDAFWINKSIGAINQLRICLWGPTTNVFRSWHQLALVLGLQLTHFCDRQFHDGSQGVKFTSTLDFNADVVITDGWPPNCATPLSLTEALLQKLGRPKLLPTPPFTIGQELDFDPLLYANFAGYQQKQWLLPVQKAIITHCLQSRL